METRSASSGAQTEPLPLNSGGKITASVLGVAVGLGTVTGGITALVLFGGASGDIGLIVLGVGAVVGFILGFILGVIDAIALNAFAKGVYARRMTPLVAAGMAAGITVLLALATVVVITMGMYAVDDDVPRIAVALSVVVWLCATWAGNRALKAALFPGGASVASLPAPRTQIASGGAAFQQAQLPAESYGVPNPRLRQHPAHPARHRPLRSLRSQAAPTHPRS